MADVNFAVTEVSAMGSTGNQDITISGFGTPKAAMFYFNVDTVNDTIGGTFRRSVGFTDGTNEAVCSFSSRNNSSTTSLTARSSSASAIILEVNDVDATTLSEASFVSFITDGVRINVSNASGSARLLKVVLINGSDVVSAKVDNKLVGNPTTVVSDLGFEASLVFVSGIGGGAPPFSSMAGILTEGFAVNDGVDSNFGLLQFDQNGQVSSVTGKYISETYCCGQYHADTITWLGNIDNYTSSGFTINSTASPASDHIFFLALEFSGSPLIDASIIDSPTTTGNKSFGSTASTPSFMYALTSDNTLVDTGQGNLATSVFLADDTNQFGLSISSSDGVTTTNTDRISKSGGLVQITGGVKQFDSTFTNFTATGADFNFTTVSGTTRKWISLFIGDGATGISITANYYQILMAGN